MYLGRRFRQLEIRNALKPLYSAYYLGEKEKRIRMAALHGPDEIFMMLPIWSYIYQHDTSVSSSVKYGMKVSKFGQRPVTRLQIYQVVET